MSNPLPAIARILALAPGEETPLKEYCFTDTAVLFGSPLTRLMGLNSVRCRFLAPRAKRFSTLGGGAAFLSNRNRGGQVILEFLQGGVSLAAVEMLDESGIGMPIVITDLASGGTSGVAGDACRVVDKGEYIRERETPLIVITLNVKRMAMFHGLRVPVIF